MSITINKDQAELMLNPPTGNMVDRLRTLSKEGLSEHEKETLTTLSVGILGLTVVTLGVAPVILAGWGIVSLANDGYDYATRPLNYDELCEKFAKLTIEKQEFKANSFSFFNPKKSLDATKEELKNRIETLYYILDGKDFTVVRELAKEKIETAILKEGSSQFTATRQSQKIIPV